MRHVADRAGTRMLFNSTLSDVRDDQSGLTLRHEVDDLAMGRDMTGVAQVRGAGVLLGIQAYIPFRGESWDKLRQLEPKERVDMIRDQSTREKLVSEAA